MEMTVTVLVLFILFTMIMCILEMYIKCIAFQFIFISKFTV